MKTSVLLCSIVLVGVFALVIGSCHKSPNEPQLVPELFGQAVYVAPGGTGNGSPDNPMGSIQQAIDSAFGHNPRMTVLISAGFYNERIEFKTGVDVSGARNRSNAWRITNNDSTVIVAPVNDSVCVTALSRNIQMPTFVDHIVLRGPDAQAPGVGSIGLLVIGCESLSFDHCSIKGGNGSKGIDGQAGTDGESSLTKARGGAGGRWHTVSPCGGDWGQSGNCYPDSLYAGTGAYGGAPGYMWGGNGGTGQDGIIGTNGRPATVLVELVQQGGGFTFLTDSGLGGSDGAWGCGGGGGGALSSTQNHGDTSQCNAGFSGTSGGTGGGGGTAGRGGTGGGSSIGILCVNSSIRLDSCFVSPNVGGAGGSGGFGGKGALGTPGAPSSWSGYPIGIGGKGGDGGDGGSGGGGMGGCAFAIALYHAAIDYDSTTELSTGVPGAGGGPSTSHGPWGLNLRTYEFDSISTVIPMPSLASSNRQ